jgi:ABC-type dipeptide/oligopeptide/nickel transport system permease component
VLKRIGNTLLREAIRSGGLLLAVSFGMFALLTLTPGDPVSMYVNVQSLSPEEVEGVRHELGLDRSFPLR